MSAWGAASHPPTVVETRYYRHGDADEQDPLVFYCRRCDVFLYRQHFENGGCPCARPGRDDATMVELGRRVLADAQQRFREGRTRVKLYRPDDAPTVWNHADTTAVDDGLGHEVEP